MKGRFGAVFLLAIAVSILLPSKGGTAESNPFLENTAYSIGALQDTILVESGRDNGTEYRYLILDDYSEAPDNWSEIGFNDSNWLLGAAPFGDRDDNNVDPQTIWNTDGDNDDIILVRHKFNVSNEVIISAEINVAFDNYCTPLINGNLVYSERNANGMEYWNDAGTESFAPSLLTSGENLLAVYARDSASGWQNRQWLDLEIKAQIFEPSTESIIFGDTVLVSINGGNKGNTSVNNFTINATSNDKLIENFSFESVPENYTSNLWVEWTPELMGQNQLEIRSSCDCNDSNMSDNFLTLNITTQIYSLESYASKDLVPVNGTRTANISIEIKNTGDLIDNITLSSSSSVPGNWDVVFTPNHFTLEPNETKSVVLTIKLPDLYDDGFYNFSYDVESQHNYIITQTLLKRGVSNDVDWKWINSTNNEDKLFDNDNWTKIDFNDTSWKNGKTPFGDNYIDCDNTCNGYEGANYKTYWQGNNYAYFRYALNISDIRLYEGGLVTVNVATNNFGDHYLNGIYLFGDMDEGGGHRADYWNDLWDGVNVESPTFFNYLKNGTNIIASIVKETQSTQWFDQEVLIEFPQANLWHYKNPSYTIPLYLDTTAPFSRVIEDGFYKNDSNVEISWKSLSEDDDLDGYYVYYIESNESVSGEWELLGFFKNHSMNITGKDGWLYKFKSIAKDNAGNLEVKSSYDTEIKVDLKLPESKLWIYEEIGNITNYQAINLRWEAENSHKDIATFLLEYRYAQNESWNSLGSFESTGNNYVGELLFSPSKEGFYEMRITSIDYAGNIEIKALRNYVNLTFDWQGPIVSLIKLNELTGTDSIFIEIEYSNEELESILLECATIEESVAAKKLIWTECGNQWTNGKAKIDLLNGYAYYFRINPIDLAGNDNSRTNKDENGAENYHIKVWTKELNSSSVKRLKLPFIPLSPILAGGPNPAINVEISVDENLDGNYERSLFDATGKNPKILTPSDYQIDYNTGEIIFGNGYVGYLPPLNSSIKITYNGYDLVTVVDLKPADSVKEPEYSIDETNNITITWTRPIDAIGFEVESKSSLNDPWVKIHTVLNNDTAKNKFEFKDENSSSGFNYYRINSIDRMGYINQNMEVKGKAYLEVFIQYEDVTTIEQDSNSDTSLDKFVLPTFLLLTIAASSAFYFLRNSKEESLPEDAIVVSALENSQEHEIMKEADGEELEVAVFSVVSGSEYSRQVLFVCETGCQNEFEVDNEDNEIMCPHCGIMGESPI